jgi:hypothetical protein
LVCLPELVGTSTALPAEAGFKFFLHGFGFYPSAFLSIEIMEDKSIDPCTSTQDPSQPKLP